MKAIRIHEFGDPEVLKLEEVPDPTPGPGQLVIKPSAIGVNPVDTYIRSGIYGPRQFPFTPGSDCAGVVKSVGPNVTRFKVGDRVYTSATASGAYAQSVLADESRVHRLPDKISFQQGAAVGIPAATAYRALVMRAQAQLGETVLVHGATGSVGTFAVQLARAAGLTVIATGGSDVGRKLVAKEGAHHVLDHHSSDYLKQIMTLTKDRGVDIVLEMLASVNLGKDLTILAKRGRVIVIGSRGPVEINPRDTMARDADIRGMTMFNCTVDEITHIHAALSMAMEEGSLRPIIDTEMLLAEAARAHTQVLEGNSHGKIVLIP